MANEKGDSHILLELAKFPSSDGKAELRMTLDEFVAKETQARSRYVSARIWFQKPDGTWLPTKNGVTIKERNLLGFGKGLRLAFDWLRDEREGR